jgi:hypothetical protein
MTQDVSPGRTWTAPQCSEAPAKTIRLSFGTGTVHTAYSPFELNPRSFSIG